MADGVNMEIVGLDKLMRWAEKFPVIAEKHINRAINRSLVRVLGEEKKVAPVHTGNLRDNWRLDIGRFQGTLASNAPYARDLHDGRMLTKLPTGETLKLWAAKKGLNPWAVAKSIAKRGHLIANPFFKNAVESQASNINKEFSAALDGIVKEAT